MTEANALLDLWLEKASDPEIKAELERLKQAGDQAAIDDAFFQNLAFGTAGLRGVIGAGTNRMNIYMVGRATQGFSDYLNEHFDELSVAIGRDSRNKGEDFVRRAAEVFAANGVKVYLYPRIEPVPALSFAVRDLKCSGGVCVTASHNPAPYNGYKAYGADGCQITTEAAKAISAAIDRVDAFDGVKSLDFEEAQQRGLVNFIGDDTLDRYIDAVYAQSVAMPDNATVGGAPSLKLVYTPLNGSGIELVKRILEKVGVTDITVVPEQEYPDGNFPTCPYPNPEIREALQKGIELCEQVKPDLLLATDPDADRVGTAVKNGDDYVLLTGNEMGVLLLDYIARAKKAAGENLDDKFAVSTIVSSMMIDALATDYGFSIKRVLTGFKYIGEFIGALEMQNEADRFLFGFEESYGYLNGAYVRDKDAVDASMLICQMAQYYKGQGMNLAQAMDALYKRYGYFKNKTVSYSYPGADGHARMAEIMADLRNNPPKDIAGYAVERVVDYAEGVDGLPNADVIEFCLPGSDKVIVRPSGTEPKIKAYLFAKGETAESAADIITEFGAAVDTLLG